MSEERAENGLASHRVSLETFLARAAGAAGATIAVARPLVGGAIQENWLLDVDFVGGAQAGLQHLVLRTDSSSTIQVSLTRPQEFALLKAAVEADVLVPEPLWLCEDPAVLGKPFYVMRRIGGTAAGHRIVKEGGPGGDKAKLAERLGEELAKTHRIRPPRADLDFLGEPPAEPALATVALYRRYLDEMPVPHPGLEWGLRWCERHAPKSERITLVHQDFRTGNYMVDENGLTGVLDWEFCAWGDPLSDIGWFCAKCWRFGRDDLEAGGIAAREPFYRGYERVAGLAIDRTAVAYWETMAHLRWAVIALQQGERVISGGETSLELALTGRLMPAELELEILRRTGPETWSANS